MQLYHRKHLNIINAAQEYLYAFTPYLIIDNEMITALCLAAKRGVDVRIVTPQIPDKKTVFCLTQSYYRQLSEAGVKIYQFTPGFIHAKCMVCDDKVATVGTINLDLQMALDDSDVVEILQNFDPLDARHSKSLKT